MADSIEIPKSTANLKTLDEFLDSISNPRIREHAQDRLKRKYEAQQSRERNRRSKFRPEEK